MATMKMFRNDLFIDWFRDNLLYRTDEYSCDTCPVGKACDKRTLEMGILCHKDNAEEFKLAIIERFSTDVEVE